MGSGGGGTRKGKKAQLAHGDTHDGGYFFGIVTLGQARPGEPFVITIRVAQAARDSVAEVNYFAFFLEAPPFGSLLTLQFTAFSGLLLFAARLSEALLAHLLEKGGFVMNPATLFTQGRQFFLEFSLAANLIGGVLWYLTLGGPKAKTNHFLENDFFS